MALTRGEQAAAGEAFPRPSASAAGRAGLATPATPEHAGTVAVALSQATLDSATLAGVRYTVHSHQL